MTLDFTLARFVHKPNCDETAFYCYFDVECKATPKNRLTHPYSRSSGIL